MKYELQIVIPAKNESGNIEPILARIDAALKSKSISYQVIFVNDYSADSTESEIINAQKRYPVILHNKIGKPGKAYAILEGAKLATSDVVAMIDADLQYPPEMLPEMYEKAKEFGMVVANRKTTNTSAARKFGSRVNKFIFGRLIMGLNCDTQSGLKVFKREIITHISENDVSPWTLDMPLLHTARELGYKIECIDIHFEERKTGQSKVKFAKASVEIGLNAIKLRTKKRKIYTIQPDNDDSAVGAGLIHKKKRYITHTMLPHKHSAVKTFHNSQKIIIFTALALLVLGLVVNAKTTAIALVGTLSFIYFIDVLFSLFVLLKSLHFPPEITATPEEIEALKDKDLPIYTILCPLYKEGEVLPHFIASIGNLSWPKDKLDVMLLLEEDDVQTQETAKNLKLPSFVRVVVVPHSFPKTKPKACNYGLGLAKGEYVVIYDAEDLPEIYQLKKAYLAFRKLGNKIFCLQSKLNYFNPSHNLLTRLFTAEYSLWFDVILPGLQSINTTIPLGGTSNHFRTQQLKDIHAWDPFNVTEDCDLGVRLFKMGFKTAIIDSETLEEANSSPKNWLRQRSRWIKGYFQTYLVHMREPWFFVRKQGIHALVFQLVIGMRITFMLINPFLWLTTISYFALYALVGPAIESLYPTVVFYVAVFSLVFGNFIYVYNYMIGCAKRGHWELIKYTFFVPIYWLMASIAAIIALYQLITKPHYWEKTNHGLHLKKANKKLAKAAAKAGMKPQSYTKEEITNKEAEKTKGEKKIFGLNKTVFTATLLIGASMGANVVNFLYSTYLGRVTGFEEFGVISVIGSILNIIQVPLSAFSRTITHKQAILFGKFGYPAKSYWKWMRARTIFPSLILSICWILSVPFLMEYFQTKHAFPFLILTPIWFIGLAGSVDSGFISGSHRFEVSAVMTIVEVLLKFFITVGLVTVGSPEYIYAAIPASAFGAFFIGWLAVVRTKTREVHALTKKEVRFPTKFFASTVMTKLSGIAFLSFDVILAKHYLNPTEAGQYALLSLVGKMVYFLGTLFSQFIVPIVSKNEGAQKSSTKTFAFILGSTTFAVTFGTIVFGILGHLTIPIILGETKAQEIIAYLPSYTFAMACITIAGAIISYNQSLHRHSFAYLSAIFSAILVIGFSYNNGSIKAFSNTLAIVAVAFLSATLQLHAIKQYVSFRFSSKKDDEGKPRGGKNILILNWRDTKHVWAGGAEAYVHETAKRLVSEGNNVVMFCGNDRKLKAKETVDGVKVLRRGGHFTVYAWAFLYYITGGQREKFDYLIESENGGVPFFTPLYSRIPKILIIHHVHQDVLKEHLSFPLSICARTIESFVMPIVYKNTQIVAVSKSTKNELLKLGFKKNENITVVNPGVSWDFSKPTKKTTHPTFAYVGRLKAYKNLSVALEAFSNVVAKYPKAIFTIAGGGEEKNRLVELTNKLNIQENVVFAGKVTDEEKAKILGQSWVCIQPSSYEGWGITVIEANANKTPVIASKVVGLSDSIVDGQTGLLVPLKNVKVLEKAMLEIIKNEPLRKNITENAYEWSKNFTWEKTAQEIVNVFKDSEIIISVSPSIAQN